MESGALARPSQRRCIATLRRVDGLSHQEETEEDQQAQASQDAKEDPLAETPQVARTVAGLSGYSRGAVGLPAPEQERREEKA